MSENQLSKVTQSVRGRNGHEKLNLCIAKNCSLHIYFHKEILTYQGRLIVQCSPDESEQATLHLSQLLKGSVWQRPLSMDTRSVHAQDRTRGVARSTLPLRASTQMCLMLPYFMGVNKSRGHSYLQRQWGMVTWCMPGRRGSWSIFKNPCDTHHASFNVMLK